jgi:hypothetical protein
VSGNFFDVLGIKPRLGRSFGPEEDSPAAKEVAAIISDECWHDKFHSDLRAVSAKIKLNGWPAVVVGVMPPGFRGTEGFALPEAHVPLAVTPRLFPSSALLTDPRERDLHLFGCLKPWNKRPNGPSGIQDALAARPKSLSESS